MVSFVQLGIALVVVSTAYAQRPCRSFPVDTCAPPFTCVRGRCTFSSEPQYCQVNSDCPGRQICIRQQCVLQDRCRTSRDCPFGLVCRDRQCVRQGGQDCLFTGCPPGLTCDRQTRQCVRGGQDCRFTGCPPGLTCDRQTRQCVPEFEDCRISGCRPGYRCDRISGECYRDVISCSQGRPCPFGQYCDRQNICRPYFSASGSGAAGGSGPAPSAAQNSNNGNNEM
ncbi:proprotein convertase subtilisin/kexin type 5-like isoform X4 [Ostrea edulis]|uniref:proprotein convertase subtilisin/kexin type 5-like isoform X4 n=1 Tax=Ostrea edulis TaxID=37623 RepID=UPI0024AEE61C|nr:proprotein convertase subtilisin/kexin type 5-like isoform X4 [Ostrea edulis]